MKNKTGLYIQDDQDGLWVHYGQLMGSRRFESWDDLRSYTLPWVAREMKRLSKRLDDLQAIQKEILGV